jgi:MYXO-CTERM domain-containing protein
VTATLRFTDDPLLARVRAGTIITLAEELPEDAAYDPDAGDWRFHLRAGARGSGQYVSATPFDVSSRDLVVLLRDAVGAVRFGPAGEPTTGGVSSRETGALRQTPTEALRRWSADYGGTDRSTFGLPNRWDDGEQDLSALRGQTGAARDVDAPDTDTGAAPAAPRAEGCGCATQRQPVGPRTAAALGWAVLSVAWATRRRRA